MSSALMCMNLRRFDARLVLLIFLHRQPIASALDQQSTKGLVDTLDSYTQT
jgi:hypothetical protein